MDSIEGRSRMIEARSSEGKEKTYRKVDISSGITFCEIQSFLIDINSDNPPGTKCLGYGHTK
jgi:hypothetical protein